MFLLVVMQSYWAMHSQNSKRITLPLDVILRNNVALSYLLDFMASIGAQAYLFFLLNTEGVFNYINILFFQIEVIISSGLTHRLENCNRTTAFKHGTRRI